VAVVAKGRASDAARINDEAPDDYIARLNDRARRRAIAMKDGKPYALALITHRDSRPPTTELTGRP
jgi:hypothetical protein